LVTLDNRGNSAKKMHLEGAKNAHAWNGRKNSTVQAADGFKAQLCRR
jgi:hypothetical protein